MFWLIIVPVLAIVLISVVANVLFKSADKEKRNSRDPEDTNIYEHTFFREKD